MELFSRCGKLSLVQKGSGMICVAFKKISTFLSVSVRVAIAKKPIDT